MRFIELHPPNSIITARCMGTLPWPLDLLYTDAYLKTLSEAGKSDICRITVRNGIQQGESGDGLKMAVAI